MQTAPGAHAGDHAALEMKRYLLSDAFLLRQIREAQSTETQITQRRKAVPVEAVPAEYAFEIMTTGRRCPFDPKVRHTGMPPTAYFCVDEENMRMFQRCSAPCCKLKRLDEKLAVALVPDDLDVEWVRRKTEFELTHFKVICPSPFYVRLNSYVDSHGHNPYDVLNSRQLTETYANMPKVMMKLSTKADVRTKKRKAETSDGDEEEAQPCDFVEMWLKDENIRTYTRMDFMPPPRLCPPDIFNTFQGYRAQALPEVEDGPAKAEPFRKHLRLMFPDKAVAAYVEKWLAWIIQKPGTPTQVFLIIKGPQGVGKNFILERLMKRIIGHAGFGMTEAPQRALFGEFGELRRNKFFVFIDDTNVGEVKMNTDKLSSLITGETILYEIKAGPTITTSNCTNFCLGTNKMFPIKASDEARREFVAQATATGPLDVRDKEASKAYFAHLHALLDDPQFIRAVYDHLMSIPLDGVCLQKDKPETPALHGIKALSADAVYHFLAEHFSTEVVAKAGRHGPTLYIAYKCWYDESGMRPGQHHSNTYFYHMLHEVPGVVYKTSKQRSGNGNHFAFDFDKLQQFLRNKGAGDPHEPV